MYAQVFKMVSLYKYCFNSCLYWNYDFGNSLMTTDLRIDGDVICYMAGHAADSRGGGLSHSLYNTKLIMMSIIDKFSPCNVNTYLTSRNPKDNFRTEIYPAYKQNRTQCPKCKTNNLVQLDKLGVNQTTGANFVVKMCKDCGKNDIRGGKPVFHNEIRAYLINRFGAKICKWGEADDWLGIDATPDTIIASIDKDLLMIPAKHWDIKKKKGLIVTDPGKIALKDGKLRGYGLYWFVAQLLLGDSIDNIPRGIKGVGDCGVYKNLVDATSLQEAYQIAKTLWLQSQYEQCQGASYDVDYEKMWLTRGQLLWIARKPREIFSEEGFYEYI